MSFFSLHRVKELKSPARWFFRRPPTHCLCAGVLRFSALCLAHSASTSNPCLGHLAYVESTRQSASTDHTTTLGASSPARCSRDRESSIPASRRSKGRGLTPFAGWVQSHQREKRGKIDKIARIYAILIFHALRSVFSPWTRKLFARPHVRKEFSVTLEGC